MSMKITREVLESHLSCKYKGHLKRQGQPGTCSDFESLLLQSREAIRQQATARILARCQPGEVGRGLPLTASTLRQGLPFLLDPVFEDDLVCLSLDGLQRVPGVSKLGDFHYVPMVFHDRSTIRPEQRLLLQVFALLLSSIQDRMPATGVIWHGPDAHSTRVRLNPDPQKARQVLQQLRQQLADPPPLILNDHCPVCEFRQRCHDQAVREDSLSLLRGVSEKEIRKQARKGIFTLTQLAHTFRPRRPSKKAQQRTPKRQHALHAMAVRDKQVYVLGTPTLPDAPVRIYLDLEGTADQAFVYLIGLLIVRDGVEEQFSFWADSKDQEQAAFEQFLAEINRHQKFVVFCYGGYERAFLRRMRKTAPDPAAVDRVLDALVNTLAVIYSHLYFPCHSNGLKDLGRFLGCSWTEPEASGLQSLVWRARWEQTGEDQWKQILLTYNQEDCLALRKVTDFVAAVTARLGPVAPGTLPPEGPPVARAPALEGFPPGRSWRAVEFVHPDFEHVNRCAYFDYQRERVYVRTSPTIRRSQRRGSQSRNRKLRSDKQVIVTDSACPSCQGTFLERDLTRLQVACPVPRLKRAFDLTLTRSGIRRQVLHSRSSVHRCLGCGHTWVPEQHQRLDKHFHGLKGWAMYQHVAHRLTLESIHTMLEEFFGVRVPRNEMMMLKMLMAGYYEPTIQQLLQAILAGNLLHVDETEVKTLTGTGYVWVFTNLEEVIYLYRPNREGDFLREMLAGFRGVLVSDFYSAYDGLDCPQQKCLIHLIRDMNQELLGNPFDEELRSVTQPFGVLLRAVVTTVDEHGLKRTQLQKHAPAVEGYFGHLSGQVFRSEAAQVLQTRLLKNRDKLFTFLNHDGVPWNNNNAENAIKQFAYYRETAPTPLYEGTLRHYLVLLSLYQTCRYKGVNFLRFLMSGERDVNQFARKGRPCERLPAVQLYPPGFSPRRYLFSSITGGSPKASDLDGNGEGTNAAGCEPDTRG